MLTSSSLKNAGICLRTTFSALLKNQLSKYISLHKSEMFHRCMQGMAHWVQYEMAHKQRMAHFKGWGMAYWSGVMHGSFVKGEAWLICQGWGMAHLSGVRHGSLVRSEAWHNGPVLGATYILMTSKSDAVRSLQWGNPNYSQDLNDWRLLKKVYT